MDVGLEILKEVLLVLLLGNDDQMLLKVSCNFAKTVLAEFINYI